MGTAGIGVIVIAYGQDPVVIADNRCRTVSRVFIAGIFHLGFHHEDVVILRHGQHVVVAGAVTVAKIVAGIIRLIKHRQILVDGLRSSRCGFADHARGIIGKAEDQRLSVLRVIGLQLCFLYGNDQVSFRLRRRGILGLRLRCGRNVVLRLRHRLRARLGRGYGRELDLSRCLAGTEAQAQRQD